MATLMPRGEIVLVGASIGRNWNLAGFGARRGLPGLRCSFVGTAGGFDKSAAIAELLARAPRPEVIIIKQCSVFFPGPMNRYQRLVRGWIDQIEGAGSMAVPATTIPAARARSAFQVGKGWVRSLIPGLEGKMHQIWGFNDWLRAQPAASAVLDLERVLQAAPGDRYLSPEFDQGDGVHVNAAGYRVMDAVLEHTLATLAARVATSCYRHDTVLA